MAIATYMPVISALGYTEAQLTNFFNKNREALNANYDRPLTKEQALIVANILVAAGNQANWPTAREISGITGYTVQACQVIIDEVIAGGAEYKRLNP